MVRWCDSVVTCTWKQISCADEEKDAYLLYFLKSFEVSAATACFGGRNSKHDGVPVFVHMIAWSDAGIRERYRGAEGARFQAAGLSKLANPLRLNGTESEREHC